MSPRSAIAWSSTGPWKANGERDLAALALLLDGGVELAEEAHLALVAEADDVAGGEPLGRLDEGPPARAVEPLGQASPRSSARRPRPMRRPFSLAGITWVSLTTSCIARRQQGRQIAQRSGRRVPARRPAAPPAAAPRRAAQPAAARCARAEGRNRTGRCAWWTSRESADTPLVGCCPPTSDAPPPRTHDLIWAFTILSGLLTGSPRLILSTFSMPSMTLPQTVYWPSRKRRVVEADEELAVAGIRVWPRAPSTRCRARAAPC